MLLNSLLDTVPGEWWAAYPFPAKEDGGRTLGTGFLLTLFSSSPVRNPVDEYVGSDYSLLNDPRVTPENIDLDFKVPAECPMQRAPLWQGSPIPRPRARSELGHVSVHLQPHCLDWRECSSLV